MNNISIVLNKAPFNLPYSGRLNNLFNRGGSFKQIDTSLRCRSQPLDAAVYIHHWIDFKKLIEDISSITFL